jgi:hypothetical protein
MSPPAGQVTPLMQISSEGAACAIRAWELVALAAGEQEIPPEDWPEIGEIARYLAVLARELLLSIHQAVGGLTPGEAEKAVTELIASQQVLYQVCAVEEDHVPHPAATTVAPVLPLRRLGVPDSGA